MKKILTLAVLSVLGSSGVVFAGDMGTGALSTLAKPVVESSKQQATSAGQAVKADSLSKISSVSGAVVNKGDALAKKTTDKVTNTSQSVTGAATDSVNTAVKVGTDKISK